MDQLIYSTSMIAYQYEFYPTSLPHTSSLAPSEKHMKLLNLLALLLVTESVGDVAAISLHQIQPDQMELCYAKNRPCTPSENEYIAEFFTMLMDRTVSKKVKSRMLIHLVLANCKNKVVARMRKVCVRLREIQDESPDFGVRANGEEGGVSQEVYCARKIRKLVGHRVFPYDISLVVFLRKWFECLLANMKQGVRFDAVENRDLVRQAVVISYTLTKKPQNEVKMDGELMDRMAKLGDFCSGVNTVLKETKIFDQLTVRGFSLTEVSYNSSFLSSFLKDFFLLLFK